MSKTRCDNCGNRTEARQSTIHRQIATKYEDLSPDEKKSDMEQVDRYWPLIQEYVGTHEALPSKHAQGVGEGTMPRGALSDHNRHMSNMVSDQDTSVKSELKEGK
jgi:hypothetical protein